MADPTVTLPVEVWARVFSHLEPTPGDPQYDLYTTAVKAQASLWQLPLVCTTFRTVFKTHPKLGHKVFLPKGEKQKYPSSTLTASLVGWLKAWAEVIQSFELHCWSVDLHQYLRALSHPSTTMTHIVVKPRGSAEACLLSSFTALTSCCLRSAYKGKYGSLDLTPLQGLCSLTKLTLQNGRFSNLSAASHLTELDLGYATVTSASSCALVSCLVKIRTHGSSVDKLHEKGLLACTALQSFRILDTCEFLAAEVADCFTICSSFPDAFVPANFSSLVCLTELSLSAQFSEWAVDLRSIGTIPNLEILIH